MTVPTSKEIIKNAEKILGQEGKYVPESSSVDMIENFVLPGLKNSKDTLGSIYKFRVRERRGLLGRFISNLQKKVSNTVINVVEYESMKQQKFNQLVYEALRILVNENKNLKEKITEIQSNK